MANNIKNFFGRFVKKNKSNNIEETEVKEVDKVSSFGYKVGDTVEQDYETEALLTELRNANTSGDKIELIAAKDPDVSMAVWMPAARQASSRLITKSACIRISPPEKVAPPLPRL